MRPISRNSHDGNPATERGFTLIELLVVISIISVLLAMLLPSLAKSRQAALAARCGTQLRQSGVALMRYAYDHKEWGPDRVYLNGSAFSGRWITEYFPNSHILRCPTDTVRPGTQGAIGGLMLNGNTQVISSYFQLLGLGNQINSTSTTHDWDNFFGWRILSGSYNPVPNLQFMGRTTLYINKNFGTSRTRTLLNPDVQAIAADGIRPTTTFFYGAVPFSTTYPTTTLANNQRNNMHPEYDGVNVMYGDGHVSWKKRSDLLLRFTTGSGSTTDIYW
jgi:prepilin-type N-terminal cleavage/methylation domain-containing protein/prepilin-type processing-associated H-X9-DG protein